MKTITINYTLFEAFKADYQAIALHGGFFHETTDSALFAPPLQPGERLQVNLVSILPGGEVVKGTAEIAWSNPPGGAGGPSFPPPGVGLRVSPAYAIAAHNALPTIQA